MMGFGLIGFIIIIAGILFFTKYFQDGRFKTSDNENALEMLKKRFIKGEISKEEYEEKKQVLL